MTRFAKCHQICFFVCSASFKRKDVMYFLGWRQPSLLLTLFAQRVCLNVFVSYASPSCPITLATVIRTFVFVVASVHHPGVFLAVTSVGKFGTAGVTARFLRLGWHWLPPHGYKKSLHGLLHTGFRFILSQLYYSTTARRSCCDKCGQTWSTFRFFKTFYCVIPKLLIIPSSTFTIVVSLK